VGDGTFITEDDDAGWGESQEEIDAIFTLNQEPFNHLSFSWIVLMLLTSTECKSTP
jgi:hypothetical protein